MSFPRVIGKVIAGNDSFLGDTTVYRIIVRCPYCNREHMHFLGSTPKKLKKYDKRILYDRRILASCYGGDYVLMVNKSTTRVK